MSRREAAIRRMIEELRGVEKRVLIDVYRHLKFAHFIGAEGKRAEPDLDRDYPSEGLFEPLRSSSGQYQDAQGLASEMIQANIERNDTLSDDVRRALVSVLARLVNERVLDAPRDEAIRREATSHEPSQSRNSGIGTWDLLIDGSIEEVNSYLEARRGTSDFDVDEAGSIQLRLPKQGLDRRPSATDETVIVTFSPPKEWTVERPRGPLAHAVPRGSTSTLCGLDRSAWTSPAVKDDTADVTCPWCRVRLLAAEIVAPQGPRPLPPARPSPKAGDILQALVGQTIHNVSHHKPNRILRIEEDVVVVATEKAPSGEPVPLRQIQAALDRLFAEGELLLNVENTGYRSAFIGAVLAQVEGITVASNPRRAILRPASGDRANTFTDRPVRHDLVDVFPASRARGGSAVFIGLRHPPNLGAQTFSVDKALKRPEVNRDLVLQDAGVTASPCVSGMP